MRHILLTIVTLGMTTVSWQGPTSLLASEPEAHSVNGRTLRAASDVAEFQVSSAAFEAARRVDVPKSDQVRVDNFDGVDTSGDIASRSGQCIVCRRPRTNYGQTMMIGVAMLVVAYRGRRTSRVADDASPPSDR